jgi:hypothetical protein
MALMVAGSLFAIEKNSWVTFKDDPKEVYQSLTKEVQGDLGANYSLGKTLVGVSLKELSEAASMSYYYETYDHGGILVLRLIKNGRIFLIENYYVFRGYQYNSNQGWNPYDGVEFAWGVKTNKVLTDVKGALTKEKIFKYVK